MTVTRRLFSRMLPAAPAAAALSAESMMEVAIAPKAAHADHRGALNRARDASGEVWDQYIKALWPQERQVSRREKYRDVMGGYSPDILSLRSVSPTFKARMLADDAIAKQDALQSLENRLRRQFGIPERI